MDFLITLVMYLIQVQIVLLPNLVQLLMVDHLYLILIQFQIILPLMLIRYLMEFQIYLKL